MPWEDILKVLSLLLGITVTVFAAAKYKINQDQKVKELEKENDQKIKELEKEKASLQEKLEVLRQNLALPYSDRVTPAVFNELQDQSRNFQKVIGAAFHSISIPFPPDNPTCLKIILSTDKDAYKILGTEFPIEAGLAGRVLREKMPSYVNKAKLDPSHFTKVDEAAGTKTGEGPIMTLPIFHSELVCGIIQFMRLPGDEFEEIDLTIAERLINSSNIGEKLSNIQRNPHTDIPSIASLQNKPFISACFTDINHYKLIASAISLGSAVSLLNDYYRRLLSRAYRYEVTVEEYLGVRTRATSRIRRIIPQLEDLEISCST